MFNDFIVCNPKKHIINLFTAPATHDKTVLVFPFQFSWVNFAQYKHSKQVIKRLFL